MAGSSDGTVYETPERFGGGENVHDFAEHDWDVGGGVSITLDAFQFELSIGASSSLFLDRHSLLLLLLLLLLLAVAGGGGGSTQTLCAGCEASQAER